jgi:hypothetical protein
MPSGGRESYTEAPEWQLIDNAGGAGEEHKLWRPS